MRNQFGEERRTYLGASEIAAACRMNKYCSVTELWELKTGKVEPEEKSIFERGHIMEDVIIKKFQEEHPEMDISDRQGEFRHPEHDFLVAHIDGVATDTDTMEQYILEIKAPGSWGIKGMMNHGLPQYYYAQVQAQMYYVDLQKALVVALDYDKWELEIFEIKRDDEFCESMFNTAVLFWNYVITDSQPFDADAPRDLSVDEDVRVRTGVVSDYLEAKAIVDDAKKKLDKAKKELIEDIGDSSKVTYDKIAKVSYGYRAGRKTVNTKGLIEHCKDVVPGFDENDWTKQGKASRALVVTPIKE